MATSTTDQDQRGPSCRGAYPGAYRGPFQGPFRGWVPLVVLPVVVMGFTPSSWPRWALMWLLAIAIFAGCKWLTWRRVMSATLHPVPWQRHVAYLLAWPGLDARSFIEADVPPRVPPSAFEWVDGWMRAVAGALLFFVLAPIADGHSALLGGWVAMIGVVVALHFGLFSLISSGWRAAGVAAAPLMRQPLRSQSLVEFWSRRWNTAFRDLTHRFLFQPLSNRLGSKGGLWAGFLFSGLVHDLVISYPAGGGYGGPTLYFALQAAAISCERSRLGRRLGLGRGKGGWVFTMVMLTVPLPLLFHNPFVLNVAAPFMRGAGVW